MMNREILFRGKRVTDGDWVYGVPIKCHDGDWQICTDSYKYTVIPSTIGQYTGLTDKSGSGVFEGDILKILDKLAYIFWSDEYAQFDYKNTSNVEGLLALSPTDWQYLEVVGNIHDNPELLKVSE